MLLFVEITCTIVFVLITSASAQPPQYQTNCTSTADCNAFNTVCLTFSCIIDQVRLQFLFLRTHFFSLRKTKRNLETTDILKYCVATPVTTLCGDKDGLWCNGYFVCDSSYQCTIQVTPPCSSPSQCAQCDEAIDLCIYASIGTDCSDNLFCNGVEMCDGVGGCMAGIPPCLNDDPCKRCNETNDVCISDIGTDCNDGLFCNGEETCDSKGNCVSSGNPCFYNGNQCNSTCNESADNCLLPKGTSCNDSLFCTSLDSCDGFGNCLGAGSPCNEDSECTNVCNENTDDCFAPFRTPCELDPFVCTEDYCDGRGVCIHPTQDGRICNDGNACTRGDRCSGSQCNGVWNCSCQYNSSCSDGNPCTDEYCLNGVCIFVSNNNPCNDSVWCNGIDTCFNGSCSIHSGNPCTGGSECNSQCNELAKDCFAPSGTTCADDGLFCNGEERCNGNGGCVGIGDPCFSRQACQDTCNEAARNCLTTEGSECDDSVFCNGIETCDGNGTCVSHGNPCQNNDLCNNTCNEQPRSCARTLGFSCDNSLFCDGNDTCDGLGRCISSGNPCPNDLNSCSGVCNETTKICTPKPRGINCGSDGLFCNGEEICDGLGACIHSGNPCRSCPQSCDEKEFLCTGVTCLVTSGTESMSTTSLLTSALTSVSTTPESPSNPIIEANSRTAITGGVLGTLVVAGAGIAAILLILKKRRQRRKRREEKHIRKIPSNASIELDSIKDIKERFDQTVIGYSELIFVVKIGRGNFGEVFRGEFQKTPVAIKKVIETELTDEIIENFKAEAEVMRRIPAHPNVVLFFGVTLPPDPICLILEYCKNGSLLTKLRSSDEISDQQKIQWAKDVAKGMYQLHSNKKKFIVIHRDLAARNVLLKKGDIAAVSDFGMARVKQEAKKEDVSRTEHAVGPLKWMAPESIRDMVYSKKTDVWSFGVLLYEIATRHEPWKGMNAIQAAHFVLNGGKLTIPANCPEIFKKLMELCWQDDPAARPPFETIIDLIREREGTRTNTNNSTTSNNSNSAEDISNYEKTPMENRIPESGYETSPIDLQNARGEIASEPVLEEISEAKFEEEAPNS